LVKEMMLETLNPENWDRIWALVHRILDETLNPVIKMIGGGRANVIQ
jgi:hypothetical protein